MAVWSGGGGTFSVSWEPFGPGEITGFVQISAQLFTNCVSLGKFCVFSKSALSYLQLCIKPLPLPPCFRLWGTRMPFISWHSPTFFALTGFFQFQPEGIPFACLSPAPPQRLLFSQSSNSSLSSPVLVLSENTVTMSQDKGFIVGLRTWNGTGSPHFPWTLLARECYTVLHGQILVLCTRKTLEILLPPGCFALSL